MKELETKEVDLSLAKEQEINAPSEDKVVEAQRPRTQKELAAERKFIRQQREIIKKEVEDMELEAKYIHYKMELPSMRLQFQKWMVENQPKPASMAEVEEKLPDNVAEIKPGPHLEKEE